MSSIRAACAETETKHAVRSKIFLANDVTVLLRRLGAYLLSIHHKGRKIRNRVYLTEVAIDTSPSRLIEVPGVELLEPIGPHIFSVVEVRDTSFEGDHIAIRGQGALSTLLNAGAAIGTGHDKVFDLSLTYNICEITTIIVVAVENSVRVFSDEFSLAVALDRLFKLRIGRAIVFVLDKDYWQIGFAGRFDGLDLLFD